MSTEIDNFQQTLYSEVGKRIKIARDIKGLSQTSLAKATSLSRTSITNIEKGRQHVPLHSLYTIANILDIQIADLLPEIKIVFKNNSMQGIPEDLPKEVREWINQTVTDTTRSKVR